VAPASPIIIAELLRWLGQPESRGHHAGSALRFGVHKVDRRPPGNGFALGHLHEVIEAWIAGKYAGLATLFTAGIIAHIPGPVLWCLRGRDLFAPALARLHPAAKYLTDHSA
jgi:protein ImuA